MGEYGVKGIESKPYVGKTFYEGLKKDPIGAIVSALYNNLGVENFHLARDNFNDLMRTIYQRGQRIKDINYAAKRLGELARYSKIQAKEQIAKLAESYIRQLPKPILIKRTPEKTAPYSLEAMVFSVYT